MHIRRHTHRIKSASLLFIGAVLVLGMASGLIIQKPVDADALSGSQFNPGRIIDDAVFFNKSTMSASQIQSFLNSKVPTCDTNGSIDGRAAYGTSRGYPPPYTCLKDYRQNTSSIAPESGICNGYTGASNESAATIIYKVAQSCGINPQVLLVMLQKEQSLVTDDWPWSIQYQKAMGAFCPDTAPCDSGYAGFFKQMYYGANRLKVYTANPTSFNYRAGRNNTIYYHPDLSRCGSSNVYIQNQATANLYIYTPYRPNQAALNNLYGEGDSCSSYGNRNFWRMFNDWFGSTLSSDLLRSPSSSTVYAVSGDTKYPIPNLATLNALYPLGGVSFVSDAYLNGLTTGPTMQRLIKGEASTIYFFDAGIKLPFTSCVTVAHFGMNCGDFAQLTDAQINKFSNGPNMPRVMNTTSNKWFYMLNGEKKEAPNQSALENNSINTTNVRLHESSLSNLPLGIPVTTSNTVVSTRSSSAKSFVSGSNRYDIPSGLRGLSFLSSMSGGLLDAASISKMTSVPFSGYASSGGISYVLTSGGKRSISSPSDLSATYTPIPAGLAAVIPNGGTTISSTDFLKSTDSATVYRVSARQKAPVASWTDLMLMDSTPTITAIPAHYTNVLTAIRLQFGPSRLVKSSTSSTVFMIDGLTSKRPVASFQTTKAAGIKSSVATTSQGVLDAYTTISANVGHRIKCGSGYYIATGGSLRSISPNLRQHYGFADNTFVGYDTMTCSALNQDSTLTARYLRAMGGKTIFYIENGTKRPITSYSAYVSSGGNSSNTYVIETGILSQITTGNVLN
jgi:hypothetical protein